MRALLASGADVNAKNKVVSRDLPCYCCWGLCACVGVQPQALQHAPVQQGVSQPPVVTFMVWPCVAQGVLTYLNLL